MNILNLSNLKLKTFTEQDALDYCQINNINPDNIYELYLGYNELTDITGIKLFKNLEELDLQYNGIKDITILKNLNKLEILILYNNQIKDISVVKNLNKLEVLYIDNLELESDQIQYIQSLNNLNTLYCRNGFKDKSIIKQLDNNINIFK